MDSLFYLFSSLGNIGYLIVFLFSFLENFIILGWLVPGTSLLVVFAFLSALGFYKWYFLVLFAFLGNFLGSIISYYLGEKYGKKAFKKGFLFLKPNFFKISKAYFHKYSGLSIIFGKLLPGIKESISFIAGIYHLNKFKFLIYLFLGAILWAGVIVSVVYLFSYSFNIALIWLERVAIIIFILVLVLIILSLLKYYLISFGKGFLSLLLDFLAYFLSKSLNKHISKSDIIRYLTLHNKYMLFFVISLAVFYLLLAFVGFLKLTYSNFFINYFDESLINLFFYLRYKVFIYFFLFISFFGKLSTLVIILLFFTLYLIYKKEYKFILPAWILFILLTLIVFLTKEIIQRPRPALSVYLESGFSFPSAHTSLGMFVFGVIFYYFFKKEKDWNKKVNIIIYFILVSFLIGFSRIYLGVHFFSDVVAGGILTLLALLFYILFVNLNVFKFKLKISISKQNFIKISYILGFMLLLNLFYYTISIDFNTTRQVGHNLDKVDNIEKYFKNKNISYTTTIVGRKTEPVNFIFLSKSDRSIIKLFQEAGFEEADKLSFKNIAKLGLSAYDKFNYSSAPFLPLFWNGKIQDFGFQKQELGLKARHHIRIWKTNFVYSGYNIYVGSAVFDDDIKWKITHKISPDIDKEREYFFQKLIQTGLLKKYEKIQLVPPIKNGKNFSYDRFFTDGKVYILIIN